MQPNLFFNGNAEEALEHYRSAVGGDVQIQRYAGSPAASTPDFDNKVLYGTLTSPLGTLNAMDAPAGRAGSPGDNFSLSIATTSEAQTKTVFAKLCEGGVVTMPLEKTFWSPLFGMCTDKFGFKWMVSLMAQA
jgi:PhnB protein